jgi:mono/diheme cytochrome c family protein
MKRMKMRTLVLALLAGGGAMASVVAGTSATQQDAGRAVYTGRGNCAVCHGMDAKGTPLAPDLTDTLWINVDGSREAIVAVIRTGVPRPKRYPAPMPPMGGTRLRDADVEAVAGYVHGLSRPK